MTKPFVQLTEVGPRDGFQAESTLIPTDLKLEVITALVDAGLQSIQIASFVHPKLVPQMADAEEICSRLQRRDGVSYTGLALNVKGLERAAAAKLDTVDLSISTSDTHSRKNTRQSLDEARAAMGAMIALGQQHGLKTRAGLQNVWGCNYEGPIPTARVLVMVEELLGAGADVISLADSTGRANPTTMTAMLKAAGKLCGDTPLVLHLHDTRGLGLANVAAALDQGVTRFDTALAGMGGCPFIPGATGNIATEDTVNLVTGMGYDTGIDLDAVAACSLRMEAFLQKTFPGKMHRLRALSGA